MARPDEQALTLPPPPPCRDTNPFATCWTRPDAMPFVAEPGDSAAVLVGRLENATWRGQLVGPHGSGKSTLLLALRLALTSVGKESRVVAANELSPGMLWRHGEAVLLVEGFERLTRHEQRRHLTDWRLADLGFVVTTHRVLRSWRAPLPVLARLRPNEATLAALYHRLVRERETPVTFDDARQSFARRVGDVRAVWFDLYDLHEQRVRSERTAAVRVAYQGRVRRRVEPLRTASCPMPAPPRR